MTRILRRNYEEAQNELLTAAQKRDIQTVESIIQNLKITNKSDCYYIVTGALVKAVISKEEHTTTTLVQTLYDTYPEDLHDVIIRLDKIDPDLSFFLVNIIVSEITSAMDIDYEAGSSEESAESNNSLEADSETSYLLDSSEEVSNSADDSQEDNVNNQASLSITTNVTNSIFSNYSLENNDVTLQIFPNTNSEAHNEVLGGSNNVMNSDI